MPPPFPPRAARARSAPSAAVVTVVFAVLLMLCLAGGTVSFLVVQSLEPRGTSTPEAALEGFLQAVFVDRDADRAADFVCADTRDDKQLARLVFEVRAFSSQNESASTRWSYPGVERTGRREASADVTLSLSTSDEQVTEKKVRLLLVDDRGWWVCEAKETG